MTTETLAKTPLHALHLELGARMVPFAGYDMPVQVRSFCAARRRHRPWSAWCQSTSSTCP